MSSELSCSYKLVVCGDEFDIPEKIFKLLWFLDGENKNYTIPKRIGTKFNYLVDVKPIAEYIEPSAISTMCRIEKPFENMLKINKSYGNYDTYLKMDKFTRYTYLHWLSDISKPSDNTMILFYALERHIFNHTKQYDNAIDVAIKILDSANDKSAFSYQVYSLLYLLENDENKNELSMNILNKYEDSTYFSFSDWYLNYRINHKKECQFDDFIRICFSKIYASNAGLISAKLRKKVLKYENVLKNVWDVYIENNGAVKFEYVVDKTKETKRKYYIPLNKSLKRKKLEMPNIIDYIKNWSEKLVEDILNIASNIKPEDINKTETDIVINTSSGFNRKYNNDILFSDLFPKIDTSCFDKYKEAYKNKQCPICGSSIKLPISSCKCSFCGSKLWVKTEILTNQKVLLDNEKFDYLKYLRNELSRRNRILQGIIKYAKLNINEVEYVYRMYEGSKSIEDVCTYILEEYIKEALESEKYELLCKTLECLSLFQYQSIYDMKGAFENRIKLALITYIINSLEIYNDYVDYIDSELQIYRFKNHIDFAAYIITSGFTTENVKNKKDSINWGEINLSIDSIVEKNPICIKGSNFKDCSNIIKNMVREQVEKRIQSLLKNSKNRIIVSDDSE